MYLIDTDIIIYSFKNNENVNKNFSDHSEEPKAISIITYGELLFGAYKSENAIKNVAKIHRIADIFPIIEITKTIIETFSNLKAKLSKSGKTSDDFDLIIASTALTMNYTIVTNNEKHFKRINGLNMVNWTRS